MRSLLLVLLFAVTFVAHSRVAFATCTEDCMAQPILDIESCSEPELSFDPCEGRADSCVPSSSAMVYSWPGDQPLQVIVSCESTCCAQEDCTSSPTEITETDRMVVSDNADTELGIVFSEQTGKCDGLQVFVADRAFENAGPHTFIYSRMELVNLDVQATDAGGCQTGKLRVPASPLSLAAMLLLLAAFAARRRVILQTPVGSAPG